MMPHTYDFTNGDELAVQKLVHDPALAINRLVLPAGQAITPHRTENRAYMIVTDGTLTLKIDDEAPCEYQAGTIVAIAAKSMMAIANHGAQTMRLFVVKPQEATTGC
jgi:quercetin dioxygenase-like cupin family protein